MSFFTKLSAAVKVITTPSSVDMNVVTVIRAADPIKVQPGMSVFETALEAGHLNESQENIASFTIVHPDLREEMVSGDYICQGGQTLKVNVNRDSKN